MLEGWDEAALQLLLRMAQEVPPFCLQQHLGARLAEPVGIFQSCCYNPLGLWIESNVFDHHYMR